MGQPWAGEGCQVIHASRRVPGCRQCITCGLYIPAPHGNVPDALSGRNEPPVAAFRCPRCQPICPQEQLHSGSRQRAGHDPTFIFTGAPVYSGRSPGSHHTCLIVGTRAANGSGTLGKRADGLYAVKVRRDGKRFSFHGHTQAEALRKAETPKPSKESLHGFLAMWLEKKRGTVRASTWRRYETTVRNSLIPDLPDLRLGALKTSDIEAALNEGELGSQATAKNARVVLGTALQYAVDTQRIPGNPCHSRVLRQRVRTT